MAQTAPGGLLRCDTWREMCFPRALIFKYPPVEYLRAEHRRGTPLVCERLVQNTAFQHHIQTVARGGRPLFQPQCLAREELERALEEAFNARGRQFPVRPG